jgi:hypothetical protein
VYSLVYPPAAAPGQAILVRGINFPHFRKATVLLNGQPVATGRVNSIGNFATAFVVPAGQPPAGQLVSVAGGRSVSAKVGLVGGGRFSAVTTSSTGATFYVSPIGGKPGIHVHLIARGLPPRTPVGIWLSNRRLAAGRSGATGGFVRGFGIPRESVGRHELLLIAGRLTMRSYLDIEPRHTIRRPPPPVVTLAAAGDIACQPGVRSTAVRCRQNDTANLLSYLDPTVVAPLGDNQYSGGALAAYMGTFDASWGRLKSRMHPAIGNHEYLTPGAAGYFTYFGAQAAPPGGWYAYDVGTWHVVVLNSNCYIIACGPGSPQETWLRANLASRPHGCTLAYFHHPRFSSAGHFVTPSLFPLWSALYDYGVDVIINGHAHIYERFAPQDPSANPTPRGIRQFTVGTGGADHDRFRGVRRNSEVRLRTFGVLYMLLRPGGYQWQFRRIGDGAVRDRGAAACH